MQPLVRQYSFELVIDRRRMRRIEADRPTTDEWYVRESMCSFDSSGRAPGRCEPWAAVPVARRGLGERAMFVPLEAGASRTGSLTRSML